MNATDFSALCRLGSFPEEASAFLADAYARLHSDPECARLLASAAGAYARQDRLPLQSLAEELARRGETIGIHRYTGEFLFYFSLLPALEERCRQKGIPHGEFLAGVLTDLNCKLQECRRVYGVWGSFVAVWFSRFFAFTLFPLGRFEFCLLPAPFSYEKDGMRIEKGQLCIDVHVPSSGRLTPEGIAASYARAASFFAKDLTAPVAFHCESWLLFSGHREMLPEKSGIQRFAADYDAVRPAPYEDDLWRIFGCSDPARPDLLPEATSLQRAYKQFLQNGGKPGAGEGMFFYRTFLQSHSQPQSEVSL